ncbi:MAG: phosphatidate cytidylyltransferase [Pseudomonadota bacterium]
MLRQRLLTAALLAPLLLLAIITLPTVWLAALLGLIVLAGAWELSQIAQISLPLHRYLAIALLALMMAAGYFTQDFGELYRLYGLVTVFWGIATLALIRRQRPLLQVIGQRWGALLIGSTFLLATWLAVVQIHQTAGVDWLISLLLLIWAVDVGAYFAGRLWGKRKLAPEVSPGKTWEGTYGAMVAAWLWAIGATWWHSVPLFVTVPLSLIITWLSIGGDLGESLLKRQAQVKDSGNLLPGHGGILDRIDSLLAAAPAFALALHLIGQMP